jgi:WD40 repeat protein
MRTISDAHSHFVTSLAMSANYPLLVSGSVDKSVALWACG